MDVEFTIRLTIPAHDEDLITNGLIEGRLKSAIIGMVPRSYRPTVYRTDKNYVPNPVVVQEAIKHAEQLFIDAGHRYHPPSEPCPANCPKFPKALKALTGPASFLDGDGCEWVRNPDGTYRCLNAEIRSMSLQDVDKEFGPLTY